MIDIEQIKKIVEPMVETNRQLVGILKQMTEANRHLNDMNEKMDKLVHKNK
jgi:hypothetical protein